MHTKKPAWMLLCLVFVVRGLCPSLLSALSLRVPEQSRSIEKYDGLQNTLRSIMREGPLCCSSHFCSLSLSLSSLSSGSVPIYPLPSFLSLPSLLSIPAPKTTRVDLANFHPPPSVNSPSEDRERSGKRRWQFRGGGKSKNRVFLPKEERDIDTEEKSNCLITDKEKSFSPRSIRSRGFGSEGGKRECC